MSIEIGLASTMQAPGEGRTSTGSITRVRPYMDELLPTEIELERSRWHSKTHDREILQTTFDAPLHSEPLTARCLMQPSAVQGYLQVCVHFLDSITIIDPSGLAAHLMYADLRDSGIWAVSPQFYPESWDFLIENWDSYDPWQEQSVTAFPDPPFPDREAQYYLAKDIVERANLIGGAPQVFTGVVNSVEILEQHPDDRITAVVQVVSGEVPFWRLWLLYNTTPDELPRDEDVVVAVNALPIARGQTARTDGAIDNAVYFFAQDVLSLGNSGVLSSVSPP